MEKTRMLKSVQYDLTADEIKNLKRESPLGLRVFQTTPPTISFAFALFSHGKLREDKFLEDCENSGVEVTETAVTTRGV